MGWSRGLLVLLVAVLALASACDKQDDGSDPEGKAELPTVSLRDDTSELLLTWIDERGGTHTALTIADVPAQARNPVRVIVKDVGHGQLFYVADLGAKQGDGSYAVRTMARSEWEALIEARRGKFREAAPSSAAAPSQEGTVAPPATNAVRAIVYGASWCGPCHQAKAFLEKRGVAVTLYDIEREPRRGDEMRQKLRAAGRHGGSIPVIDLGGQIVVGFNPSVLERAIHQARQGRGTAL